MGIPDVTDQDIVSTSIINGLLLCVDLDNYFGGTAYNSSFEVIYECGTNPQASTRDCGNSYGITCVRVLIIFIFPEGISEAISDGTVLYDVKWVVFSSTITIVKTFQSMYLDDFTIFIYIDPFPGLNRSTP